MTSATFQHLLKFDTSLIRQDLVLERVEESLQLVKPSQAHIVVFVGNLPLLKLHDFLLEHEAAPRGGVLPLHELIDGGYGLGVHCSVVEKQGREASPSPL